MAHSAAYEVARFGVAQVDHGLSVIVRCQSVGYLTRVVI